MEAIATILVIGGLLAAGISRMIENDREEARIARMSQRTNKRPWQRRGQ